MCSAGFCYCLLLLTPNYQWIQVEWSGAFSKHPKEATLWRELRKYVFSPSGAVRDKNPLWAWAVIFVTSAHAWPDVRNFLTSGNGCVQSPSFLYHVTEKRWALGTRMQKQLDTKMLWNHLRNNWKTKGFTSYESYMSVLECFVIGDFLVGDPPPVIFFGIY